MFEIIIVFIITSGAVFFAARSFIRIIRGNEKGGCCGDCLYCKSNRHNINTPGQEKK